MAGRDAVPEAHYARLTRGVNLVGWFSEGGDIPFMPIGPPDAQIMAESGLRHVRLPIDSRRVLARYTPPAAIARTRDDLDGAVASAGASATACS
jgi:hypothetical protein